MVTTYSHQEMAKWAMLARERMPEVEAKGYFVRYISWNYDRSGGLGIVRKDDHEGEHLVVSREFGWNGRVAGEDGDADLTTGYPGPELTDETFTEFLAACREAT